MSDRYSVHQYGLQDCRGRWRGYLGDGITDQAKDTYGVYDDEDEAKNVCDRLNRDLDDCESGPGCGCACPQYGVDEWSPLDDVPEQLVNVRFDDAFDEIERLRDEGKWHASGDDTYEIAAEYYDDPDAH